jgi:hypothetical protein
MAPVEFVLLLFRQGFDLLLAHAEAGFETRWRGIWPSTFSISMTDEELFDGGGVRGGEFGEAAGESECDEDGGERGVFS